MSVSVCVVCVCECVCGVCVCACVCVSVWCVCVCVCVNEGVQIIPKSSRDCLSATRVSEVGGDAPNSGESGGNCTRCEHCTQ